MGIQEISEGRAQSFGFPKPFKAQAVEHRSEERFVRRPLGVPKREHLQTIGEKGNIINWLGPALNLKVGAVLR
jgi:hypothetical protein